MALSACGCWDGPWFGTTNPPRCIYHSTPNGNFTINWPYNNWGSQLWQWDGYGKQGWSTNLLTWSQLPGDPELLVVNLQKRIEDLKSISSLNKEEAEHDCWVEVEQMLLALTALIAKARAARSLPEAGETTETDDEQALVPNQGG